MARLHEEMAARGHATHQSVRWQGWRTELPDTWDALPGRPAEIAPQQRARLRSENSSIPAACDCGAPKPPPTSRGRSRSSSTCIKSAVACCNSRAVSPRPRLPRSIANWPSVSWQIGKLRLSWLELDDAPIAIEYSFTGGDTVYYYQGGFDPGVSQLGPGWLMSALSLRAAIAEGYRYFDFLRGDEPYKASWNATPRPLVERRVAGRRPRRACDTRRGKQARRFGVGPPSVGRSSPGAAPPPWGALPRPERTDLGLAGFRRLLAPRRPGSARARCCRWSDSWPEEGAHERLRLTFKRCRPALPAEQTIRRLRTFGLGAYYHATLPYRAWQSARRAAAGTLARHGAVLPSHRRYTWKSLDDLAASVRAANRLAEAEFRSGFARGSAAAYRLGQTTAGRRSASPSTTATPTIARWRCRCCWI